MIVWLRILYSKSDTESDYSENLCIWKGIQENVGEIWKEGGERGQKSHSNLRQVWTGERTMWTGYIRKDANLSLLVITSLFTNYGSESFILMFWDFRMRILCSQFGTEQQNSLFINTCIFSLKKFCEWTFCCDLPRQSRSNLCRFIFLCVIRPTTSQRITFLKFTLIILV